MKRHADVRYNTQLLSHPTAQPDPTMMQDQRLSSGVSSAHHQPNANVYVLDVPLPPTIHVAASCTRRPAPTHIFGNSGAYQLFTI
jgi:hypothetical protein